MTSPYPKSPRMSPYRIGSVTMMSVVVEGPVLWTTDQIDNQFKRFGRADVLVSNWWFWRVVVVVVVTMVMMIVNVPSISR